MNSTNTHLYLKNISNLQKSWYESVFRVIASYPNIIGHIQIKPIEKITFGFNDTASTIFPCKNSMVALVTPHPGQGI